MESRPTVVLDNGGSTIKAGMVRPGHEDNDEPRYAGLTQSYLWPKDVP